MKKAGFNLFFIIFSTSILGRGILFADEIKKKVVQPNLKAVANLTKGSQKLSRSPQPEILLNKSFLKPAPVVTKYNEPWDLVELVPIVRDINRMIPRKFSLVNNDVRLDSNQMVIVHQFLDARARSAAKQSVITFSYSGPLGSRMGTRLDVPLFYSPDFLSLFNWQSYPMGNYTMTISRNNPSGEDTLFIKAQTRF